MNHIRVDESTVRPCKVAATLRSVSIRPYDIAELVEPISDVHVYVVIGALGVIC